MKGEAVNIQDLKFQDKKGVYGYSSSAVFAIKVEGKGYLSFDGVKPYIPAGGKKACIDIINSSMDLGEVEYVNPLREIPIF